MKEESRSLYLHWLSRLSEQRRINRILLNVLLYKVAYTPYSRQCMVQCILGGLYGASDPTRLRIFKTLSCQKTVTSIRWPKPARFGFPKVKLRRISQLIAIRKSGRLEGVNRIEGEARKQTRKITDGKLSFVFENSKQKLFFRS